MFTEQLLIVELFPRKHQSLFIDGHIDFLLDDLFQLEDRNLPKIKCTSGRVWNS